MILTPGHLSIYVQVRFHDRAEKPDTSLCFHGADRESRESQAEIGAQMQQGTGQRRGGDGIWSRQPSFKSWFHYGLVVGQVTYPLVASVSSSVKWGQQEHLQDCEEEMA